MGWAVCLWYWDWLQQSCVAAPQLPYSVLPHPFLCPSAPFSQLRPVFFPIHSYFSPNRQSWLHVLLPVQLPLYHQPFKMSHPCPCKLPSTSLQLSMELVCFSRNTPLMISKIQLLHQLLALSVTSSSFLMSHPVVFHILFIQRNFGPSPSHLPAAVMRSNWLTGHFANARLLERRAAARVANAWRSFGPHNVKITERLCKSQSWESGWSCCCRCSVTFATSPSCLGCSSGSCWLSSGTTTKRTTHRVCTLLCFVLCTSACREPSLAPSLKGFHGRSWEKDTIFSL